MTKLQSSLAKEETWVDGTTEKLTALPTATSAYELDVSTSTLISIIDTKFNENFMHETQKPNKKNTKQTNTFTHNKEIFIEKSKSPTNSLHRFVSLYHYFQRTYTIIILPSSTLVIYSV